MCFQIDSAKPGTAPGSEGMLANFFNSLLNKNPKGGTPVAGTKAGVFLSCHFDIFS